MKERELEAWARFKVQCILSCAPSLPDPTPEEVDAMAGYLMGLRINWERSMTEAHKRENSPTPLESVGD